MSHPRRKFRKQPNPTRFPRNIARGKLRSCIVCREAGIIFPHPFLKERDEDGKSKPAIVWRPGTLELVGQKVVVLPDALTKKPTKSEVRLYIHARRQTQCQSTFAQQSLQAASSEAG